MKPRKSVNGLANNSAFLGVHTTTLPLAYIIIKFQTLNWNWNLRFVHPGVETVRDKRDEGPTNDWGSYNSISVTTPSERLQLRPRSILQNGRWCALDGSGGGLAHDVTYKWKWKQSCKLFNIYNFYTWVWIKRDTRLPKLQTNQTIFHEII